MLWTLTGFPLCSGCGDSGVSTNVNLFGKGVAEKPTNKKGNALKKQLFLGSILK